MAADDVYQLTDKQQGSGGINAVNTFHFVQVSGDVADHRAETDLADIWDNQLLVLLIALQSDEWYHRQTSIRRIAPTPHATLDYGVTNSQGSVAETSYPPDHSVDVSWYTGTFDRTGRGRNRFPGVPISYAHGGVLTSAAFSLWLVASDAFLPDLTGPEGYVFRFCICPNDGSSPHDVLMHRVRTQLKTLRSRTEGNGW
jgi:hypothetical protein